MTTLISWITFCDSKQNSIYIASDSRFSLAGSNGRNWDFGRKIYASNTGPDIFGYCGDVIFCSQALSQLVTYIDSFGLLKHNMPFDKKVTLIFDLLKNSFSSYTEFIKPTSLEILYATRRDKSNFALCSFSYSGRDGWRFEEIRPKETTNLLKVSGSGSQHYTEMFNSKYLHSGLESYSRSYFSCLYMHIVSNKDPMTGGPPQVAGIFNRENAILHGVIYENRRYIYGLEVNADWTENKIRWVNQFFENCDGITMERLDAAQRQPFPQKDSKRQKPKLPG